MLSGRSDGLQRPLRIDHFRIFSPHSVGLCPELPAGEGREEMGVLGGREGGGGGGLRVGM